MAKAPVSEEILKEEFGPHLNYKPPGGWNDESVHPAEKLVKTHCCFCGQQCGIQLKVRENRVIGFEPWEEFPFNHGDDGLKPKSWCCGINSTSCSCVRYIGYV